MDPGKKMDELVAEKVLGWVRSDGKWQEPDYDVEIDSLPAFSTDIAAAWTLADKICEKGYRLRIEGSKIWKATFYKSVSHTLETHTLSLTGSTPAEAICLAALALKGVELAKD